MSFERAVIPGTFRGKEDIYRGPEADRKKRDAPRTNAFWKVSVTRLKRVGNAKDSAEE